MEGEGGFREGGEGEKGGGGGEGQFRRKTMV